MFALLGVWMANLNLILEGFLGVESANGADIAGFVIIAQAAVATAGCDWRRDVKQGDVGSFVLLLAGSNMVVWMWLRLWRELSMASTGR